MKLKSNLFLRSSLAAIVLLGSSVLHAATFYWDVDGSGTVGFGIAGGTWGSSTYWGTASNGDGATYNTIITTADDVNFGTDTAGLATGVVTGPSTAQGFLSMTFGSASGDIVLSGGTLNMASTSTITVNNATATVSSVLQGIGNVIKAGTGTLTLSGNNSYTLLTTVSAGTLKVGHVNALGTIGSFNTRTALANGAILELATDTSVAREWLDLGSSVVGSVVVNRATEGAGITQSMGTLYLGTNAKLNVTLGSNVTSGIATLGLSSLIMAGGSSGSATFNPTNAAVSITGSVYSGVNYTKTLVLDGTNANNAISGIISNGSGTVSLLKSNSSSWTLSNANTYTGNTSITAGLLNLNCTTGGSAILGDVSMSTSSSSNRPVLFLQGDNQLESTATVSGTISGSKATYTEFVLGGYKQTIASYSAAGSVSTGSNIIENDLSTSTGVGGTGILTINNSSLVILGSASGRVAIRDGGSGTLGLVKEGEGTLSMNLYTGGVFSSTSYTGGFTLKSGTVQVAGVAFYNNALSLQGGTLSSGDATARAFSNNLVSLAGDVTLGDATNNGKLTFGGAATLTGNRTLTTASDVEFTAAIGQDEAGRGLTKSGAGTLTLSGANTYTGTTTVSAGTLALGNLNALQNSTLDTSTSASQAVTFTVLGTNTYNIGGLQGADDLDFGANTLSVGSNAAHTAFSGALNGSGGLTKVGGGSLTLSGANTYTGTTTISAGTLKVGNADALGEAGNYASRTIINNGGTLELATNSSVTNEYLDILTNNSGAVVVNRATEGAGITQSTGFTYLGSNSALNVTKGGNVTSGTATLGVTNVVLASGSVGIGTLNSDTAAISVTGSVSSGVAFAKTLALTGSHAESMISGAISNGSGTVALTKSGLGTWTLTGTNTYTGATTVSAGKLVVNGSIAIGGVTVQSGATLGGSGTLGGTTIIESGGILAPGNSPGVESFDNLTYADGSIFSWEIDRTLNQTRGNGYDGVNVANTLTGQDGADDNTTFDAKFRIVIGDADFSNVFWNETRNWADIFTEEDGTTAKNNWASIFGGGFEYYYNDGTEITSISPATQGSFSFTNNGSTLTWTAVPEPSSALAGLLIAAGLLRRRRSA